MATERMAGRVTDRGGASACVIELPAVAERTSVAERTQSPVSIRVGTVFSTAVFNTITAGARSILD